MVEDKEKREEIIKTYNPTCCPRCGGRDTLHNTEGPEILEEVKTIYYYKRCLRCNIHFTLKVPFWWMEIGSKLHKNLYYNKEGGKKC